MRIKECPRRESFADGSIGGKVRLMVIRGGCLTVRGSGMMTLKYQDDLCVCVEKLKQRNLYYVNANNKD